MPETRGARMQLQRFATPEGLLAVASDFLVEREAQHNLILGILGNLMARPDEERPAPYFAAGVDGGRVLGVAILTPPWQIVLSEMDDARVVDLVVADRREDPLPGVLGPTRLAARFAERWSRETSQSSRLAMRERIFELTRVERPRPASGRMRPVRPTERALLLEWLADFMAEAVPGDPIGDLGPIADRWIEGASRTMYLWVDGGLPVSMAGVGSPTPHGVRVGPVYTPPDRRGRGYASNLVAAASDEALAAGNRFCFLFTDLANPTSNRIYQEIGYEPITDVDRWVFDPS